MTRFQRWMSAALPALILWLLHPMYVKNLEAVMERRGWDKALDTTFTALPEYVSGMISQSSQFWGGVAATFALWGATEMLVLGWRKAAAYFAKPPKIETETDFRQLGERLILAGDKIKVALDGGDTASAYYELLPLSLAMDEAEIISPDTHGIAHKQALEVWLAYCRSIGPLLRDGRRDHAEWMAGGLVEQFNEGAFNKPRTVRKRASRK